MQSLIPVDNALCLIIWSILLMDRSCTWTLCIDGIWSIGSLTFLGEPSFLALFLIPPFKHSFLSRLTYTKFFAYPPYSWLFMPYTCLFFFFSSFYFLFSISPFSKFQPFYKQIPKTIERATKMEIRTTAKHHRIIIWRCKLHCFSKGVLDKFL